MAADWIKMRTDLAGDPAVIRIRRATGVDADAVVGKLHRLWSWADAHTADGFAAGLDAEWVDEFAGCHGFADAMVAAGWLEVDAAGVRFTNFERHNGQPAKVRALRKTRMERFRGARSATDAPPEKRREEEIEELPAAPVATSEPPKRRIRSRPADGIGWTADAGWQGITDADAAEWRLAYPACDLPGELARATAWLKANPAKAHKSNWRRFLVAWLTRSQDKGGTNRTPGLRPDAKPPPVDQAKRRFYRADAARQMTDGEYAAWRRDQATGGMVAAVAGAVTLREEP